MKAVNIIPFFVIIPLAAAFLISILGKLIKRFSDIVACLSCAFLFGFSLYTQVIFKSGLDNVLVYKIGGWVPPFGISLVLDGLSSFMLVTVNLISLLIAIYSVSYMRQYTDKPKFFTLFSLMVCGMNGIIITGDLFNLFVDIFVYF